MSERNRIMFSEQLLKIMKDALCTKRKLKEIAGFKANKIEYKENVKEYVGELLKSLPVDDEDLCVCSEYLSARYMSVVEMYSGYTNQFFVDTVMIITAVGQFNVSRVEQALEKVMVINGPESLRWEVLEVAAELPLLAERRYMVFVNHQLISQLESELHFNEYVSESCFDTNESIAYKKYFFLNEVSHSSVECEGLIKRAIESIIVSKVVNAGQGVIVMSGFPFGLTEMGKDDESKACIEEVIRQSFYRLVSGDLTDNHRVNLPIEL